MYLYAELRINSLDIRDLKLCTWSVSRGCVETISDSPLPELWTPVAGVGKAPSEGAALSLAMIQVHKKVWAVSCFRHKVQWGEYHSVHTHKHTHVLCISTQTHLCISFSWRYLQKCSPQHSRHRYECLLGFIPCILWSMYFIPCVLWAVMQSQGAVSSSYNLKQWAPACPWCSAGFDCYVWHTAAFHRWAGALRVAGHPQHRQLPAQTLPNVTAFQQPFESPALQDCV